MAKLKSVAISKARPNLTQLVEDADNKGETYVIISKSKPRAVLVGIDQYNEMVDRLEKIDEFTKSTLHDADIEEREIVKELNRRESEDVTTRLYSEYRSARIARWKPE